MPKYVVSNSDETQQALDPEGGNVKVGFNKSETSRTQDKSRIRRVLIIALVVICCVVVFLLCAWFVYAVFIKSTPQWQADDFLIETIPGLRHGPKEPDGYANSTLIAFAAKKIESYKKWTDVMEDFVGDFNNGIKGPNNIVYCDYNEPPRPGHVCAVDIKAMFPCTKEYNFGYNKATPCIFVRFNKIANWTPQYYNSSSELPPDMPSDLKHKITEYYTTYRTLIKTVWLSCEGENAIDVENVGPIQYLPRPGFPGYYFPYNNTKNYISPVVALRFEKPRTGVLIRVECRLWAPNIEYNREEGKGLVQFQLLVD